MLRRLSGDRDCIAVEVDFTPQERAGQLINPTDRLFLVSPKDLVVPPVEDRDVLVTFVVGSDTVEDEHLKIVQPPGKLAPAGTVVYWELQVRA
jgi:hypothetical protein